LKDRCFISSIKIGDVRHVSVRGVIKGRITQEREVRVKGEQEQNKEIEAPLSKGSFYSHFLKSSNWLIMHSHTHTSRCTRTYWNRLWRQHTLQVCKVLGEK